MSKFNWGRMAALTKKSFAGVIFVLSGILKTLDFIIHKVRMNY
jgi:hypothetical protein